MIAKPMPLADAWCFEPEVHSDHRGYFSEIYRDDRFREMTGWQGQWTQDNLSCSRQTGTLRGLHYQVGTHAQSKLVQVVVGEVFDVIVDLRPGSDTYGQSASMFLSAKTHRQLYVPKEFAHGFCTMAPDTLVLYKVDAPRVPDAEAGIRWDDPDLNIAWPVTKPVLSGRDRKWPSFEQSKPTF